MLTEEQKLGIHAKCLYVLILYRQAELLKLIKLYEDVREQQDQC